MADSSEYVPAKVWVWNKPNGGRFANINRPIFGPTHEKDCRSVVTLFSSIRLAHRTA